jgi:putative sterol carrier protein
MAQSVSEFFEGLPSRADPSKIAGMSNTYRFEVDGAGTWTVDVNDGQVTVTQNGDAEPDCTISTSEKTFQKLVAGEQNPTTAYMTGKVKIKGDMGAAMKLQKLF